MRSSQNVRNRKKRTNRKKLSRKSRKNMKRRSTRKTKQKRMQMGGMNFDSLMDRLPNSLSTITPKWATDNKVDFRTLVLKAIEMDSRCIMEAQHLKGDREVVLSAVRKGELFSWELRCASPELRDDRGVVLEALEFNGDALCYVSQKLRDDKEVVTKAVENYPFSLQYAGKTVRANRDVINLAVEKCGGTLKFASPDLQNDPELIYKALTETNYPLTPGYINDRDLFKNLRVVEGILKQNPDSDYASHIHKKIWHSVIFKTPAPPPAQQSPSSQSLLQFPEDDLFMRIGAYEPFTDNYPFRMGIEIECCGNVKDLSEEEEHCEEGEHCENLVKKGGVYNGKDVLEPLFDMTTDEVVICGKGKCAGEIILKNDKVLKFDGVSYTIEGEEPDSFMDAVENIGDNFKPTLFGGGRFQVHISGGENYSTTGGLNFAKTLLCLWAMDREGLKYHEIFDLRGHDDMTDAVRRPKYFDISKVEMRGQFETRMMDMLGFREFLKNKLPKRVLIGHDKYKNRVHYAGMFFYSLFDSFKYPERPDTATEQSIRLEFRGFHDPMDIAHLLSQAPAGHSRHRQSPGKIFRDYVDMHMKDVHFFFNLAYKTSGNFPEHEESTRMVRNGTSIDAIIAQVRLEDEQRRTGTPAAQVKTSQTGPPSEASEASGSRE